MLVAAVTDKVFLPNLEHVTCKVFDEIQCFFTSKVEHCEYHGQISLIQYFSPKTLI